MNTSAADLRTIATTWVDLNDALGMPTTIGGFGRGLHSYLATVDALNALEAEELEAAGHHHQRLIHTQNRHGQHWYDCADCEHVGDGHDHAPRDRTLDQIGQRPIPMKLEVYATMRAIEGALTGCAAAVAEHVQRHPIPMPSPRRAAYARTRAERVAWDDHARRVQAAQDDAADPRRWKWTGTPVSAPYAALWLLARVEGRPGPFRPLQPAQQQHIGHVAAEGRHRVEHILDTGAAEAELSKPCPDCGGVIKVYGGAGSSPLANCSSCGGIWTELGAAA